MSTSRFGYPFFPLEPAVENQVPVTFDSASVNDGGFIVDGEITRDTRPALNGYAGRGVTLECYHHGELVGSTLSDAQTGYFSFTLPAALAGGSHQFVAQVAAMPQSASAPFTLIVEDAGFVPVTLTAMHSGTQFIWPEESTTQTQPTFSGKGQPGSRVELFDNDEPLGSALVDSDHKWTFTPSHALAAGEHQIVVTCGAGNVSAPVSLIVADDITGDVARPEALSGLHLHDLLASVPVNLFQDAELNPATQQYELVLNNDDLQQELTQSGIVGHSLVLTEQDLQQLLGDVPL